MGLCLDAAHAYFWSPKETSLLVSKFKERITQVHFSATFRNKDHMLFCNASKSFRDSVKPLRKLSVPIVIEGSIKQKSISLLRKEIKSVRDFFS
ncbi:MAG TPA: hypothetical protein ENN46_01990 [Candidatus Woesearchaeota archaeon]|nr:hypothetical protein [Candidatus Woesearchaeota archaeon]